MGFHYAYATIPHHAEFYNVRRTIPHHIRFHYVYHTIPYHVGFHYAYHTIPDHTILYQTIPSTIPRHTTPLAHPSHIQEATAANQACVARDVHKDGLG